MENDYEVVIYIFITVCTFNYYVPGMCFNLKHEFQMKPHIWALAISEAVPFLWQQSVHVILTW